MNAGKAFFAGVVAGAAMSILMAAGRALAIPLDVEMTLGTLFGLAPGAPAWMLGFVVHLFLSGLIALIYARGFESVARGPGWAMGAAFSLLHVVLAGMAAGLMGLIHPLMPTPLDVPGLFAINLGVPAALLFIVMHVVYGTLVGGFYAAEPEAEKPREAWA